MVYNNITLHVAFELPVQSGSLPSTRFHSETQTEGAASVWICHLHGSENSEGWLQPACDGGCDLSDGS